MAFTQAQLDYVKEQVEANPGFLFRDAGNNEFTGKFFLNFTAPDGRDGSLHIAVKNRKEWLTDEAQFADVVAEGVDWMLKHFS